MIHTALQRGQPMKSEFPVEYIKLQGVARDIADCALLVYYATDSAAQERHYAELMIHIKRIKELMEDLQCPK